MGKSDKIVTETITVVGFRYRLSSDELKDLQRRIENDGALVCQLELEPENQADPKAIKVVAVDPEDRVFSGRHLGYVARPVNESIFDFLRKGGKISACLLEFVDRAEGYGELEVAFSKPRS